MSTATISLGRPQPGEYAPYFDRYISLVEADDILTVLDKEWNETVALFQSAGAKADFRYQPGKWSVKEVLGHMSDTERILSYRAMRVARGDQTPMEGYEPDDYVRGSNFSQRTLADLIDEFVDVRRATLALFRSLDAEAGLRRGTASNNPVSTRALAFIIAGHELHHRRILSEKYLR